MQPEQHREDQRADAEHDRERSEGEEAARRPADLCPAQRREQLLALALGLALLPVVGRAERRQEHECARDPERREDWCVVSAGARGAGGLGHSQKPNLNRYMASVG